MANKTTGELTAADLPLDGTELFHLVQGGNSRKASHDDIMAEVKWLGRAIGEPFPLWDHLVGCDVPPIDSARYRFIMLTAGENGSGEYNEGALTSESVTGTAPLVVATATINDADSPMFGQVVSLINTERRVLRAGASGTAQADSLQGFRVRFGSGDGTSDNTVLPGNNSGSAYAAPWSNASGANQFSFFQLLTDGTNGTPRFANETRGKNIGATYYMRIR